VNHLFNLRSACAISLSFALPLPCILAAVAQDESTTPPPGDADLPVTISILQDVQVNAVAENPGADAASRYSLVTLGFRKTQQFQMIDIHLEGGCRILFEDREYDMASCPWLPGFRDHEEDIFKVMKNF
jgi:hypothetical protein